MHQHQLGGTWREGWSRVSRYTLPWVAVSALGLLEPCAVNAQATSPQPAAPPSVEAAPAPAPQGGAAPAAAKPSESTQESGPSFDARFGKGATIRSAGETFTLNIRGRIQARATVLEQSGDGEKPVTEFAIRRMRLVFQGNARGPTLTYYIQLAFSNQDTEPDLRLPLRDAYITWSRVRDANIRFGQMKVPYGRQRVVSSSALQMADRSIVTTELNLDRDVGATLFSKDLLGLGGKLGYNLGIFGGDGRNRLGERFGYLYSARLEAWPFGMFDEIVEADIKRDPKPRLALGAGVAYNQNTDRPRSTTGVPFPGGSFDYLHAGADFIFKWSGLSLQGEFMFRRADQDTRTVDVDGTPTPIAARQAWGVYVQAGQMLTGHLELSARYGHLEPLSGNVDPELVDSEELGGALSYYFDEHNLKVQADYFYLPVDGFADGDHQVRLQSQLYF